MRTCALVLLLASPVAAAAQTWAESFPPEVVATWIAAPGTSLIVVPAGQPDPELSAAGSALITALRASGRTALVMDAAALGDVSALDDAAIVRRASHLPVDEVVIVRVFPGASPVAVVGHHGKDGNARGGYSSARGEAIARRESSGAGVSEQAARALAREEEARVEPPPPPSYEDEYVHFEDVLSVRAGAGKVHVQQGIAPVQGKHKRPLEGAEFYEVVGRPDLATSYRRTQVTRLGLAIVGGGLMIGGLVYALTPDDCPTGRIGEVLGGDGSACEAAASQRLWIGAGGAVLGSVLGSIGAFLNPHPVDAYGARKIADEHNQKLRGRDARLGPTLQPAVIASRDAAGLGLTGSF